ncbi:peptidogalycan biosysnthesis protein [Paraburkholderia fungorum]|uniref:peptidogalycan biosysnthesis protein n=1 Tax=Paraburkholderia fungorum TaxID=134537 RepID=UPI00402B4B59
MQGTKCASKSRGWQPTYRLMRRGAELASAMPLYLKCHSWGEYMFVPCLGRCIRATQISVSPRPPPQCHTRQ